jgi:pteridine reductase
MLRAMPGFRPVALITGGAKRVGAAIARKLAHEGFDVTFTYHRSAAEAQNLALELQNAGARAIASQADLSSPEEAVDAILAALETSFTRLDLLVNNASEFARGELAQVTLAQVRRNQAIHFESPLLLAKAFAEKLRNTGGSIVNMVDLLAERPFPTYLAYCASKASLANLTLSLARELAPEVTVNGIAPGVVDWPEEYTLDMREKYLQRVPLKRSGTPEDVANLVHFLATSGKYITGQILRLDGGRSLT